DVCELGGDDVAEWRAMWMGVAAAVRSASFETPGDDETFGTVRFESSSSGTSEPLELERCAAWKPADVKISVSPVPSTGAAVATMTAVCRPVPSGSTVGYAARRR